jgi:hypothetical protein
MNLSFEGCFLPTGEELAGKKCDPVINPIIHQILV